MKVSGQFHTAVVLPPGKVTPVDFLYHLFDHAFSCVEVEVLIAYCHVIGMVGVEQGHVFFWRTDQVE